MEPLDLPTQTDFEAQAETEITETNVDVKLTALEKELAQ
jgi:hypothetical protein